MLGRERHQPFGAVRRWRQLRAQDIGAHRRDPRRSAPGMPVGLALDVSRTDHTHPVEAGAGDDHGPGDRRGKGVRVQEQDECSLTEQLGLDIAGARLGHPSHQFVAVPLELGSRVVTCDDLSDRTFHFAGAVQVVVRGRGFARSACDPPTDTCLSCGTDRGGTPVPQRRAAVGWLDEINAHNVS